MDIGRKKRTVMKLKSLIMACATACAFAAPAMAEGGMFEGALPENWTADVVAGVKYNFYNFHNWQQDGTSNYTWMVTFDADVQGGVDFDGTQVRHYSDNNYNYTETKHYLVQVSGGMRFSGKETEASSWTAALQCERLASASSSSGENSLSSTSTLNTR